MILLSILMTASSLAGQAPMDQSPLAPAEHQHQWSELAENSPIGIWLDRNWHETVTIEGQTYPVALVRTENPIFRMDEKIAVDCKSGRKTTIEKYEQGLEMAASPSHDKYPPAFGYSPQALHYEDMEIIEAVCQQNGIKVTWPREKAK